MKKFSFNPQIVFWQKWQLQKIFAKVSMPSQLKEKRTASFKAPGSNDTITDNPLIHGATYVALKTRTTYLNKVWLYADLYAEQRGCSYGIYNTKNNIVYPVVRLEALDSLKMEKHPIIFKAKVGEFLDEQLDEGLMVYNMDAQGFQLTAQYRSLLFEFTMYGDLCNGIGLNIDDLVSYTVKKLFTNKNAVIGASFVIARPPFSPLNNCYNLNFFAQKNFFNGIIYGQAGYRPFENYFLVTDHIPMSHHFAFVSGVEMKKEKKNINLSLKVEARYYGNMFNFGNYTGGQFLYRDPAGDIYENYANTTGPFLYPLRKFDAPFSQWGVLTEFQGYNIAMITVLARPVIRLNNKFEMFTDLDINYITGSLDKFWSYPEHNRTVDFIYPFFETGIGYKPVDNSIAKISITNKSMNLDVSYPTHYLLKKPCVQLSLLAKF
jgi:hypothetical protein